MQDLISQIPSFRPINRDQCAPFQLQLALSLLFNNIDSHHSLVSIDSVEVERTLSYKKWQLCVSDAVDV